MEIKTTIRSKLNDVVENNFLSNVEVLKQRVTQLEEENLKLKDRLVLNYFKDKLSLKFKFTESQYAKENRELIRNKRIYTFLYNIGFYTNYAEEFDSEFGYVNYQQLKRVFQNLLEEIESQEVNANESQGE